MPAGSSIASSSGRNCEENKRKGQQILNNNLVPASRRPCLQKNTPKKYPAHQNQPLSDTGISLSTQARRTPNTTALVREASDDADEGGSNSDGDQEGSFCQEVIMAMDMKENGSMSCAYLSTAHGVLYLSEDITKADNDTAEQFIIHVQPTTVLASARAPERFLMFLEQQAACSTSGINHSMAHYAIYSSFIGNGGFILRHMQSSDFSIESATERLVNLAVDTAKAIFTTGINEGQIGVKDTGGNASHQDSQIFRTMRCGASINLNSHISVCLTYAYNSFPPDSHLLG